MKTKRWETLYVAPAISAALDALAECGSAGAPLAGGTWIMRSPIRHELFKARYIALSKIPELRTIINNTEALEIGAAVTHAELAAAVAEIPGLEVLASAAERSANPAIRAMATIGGNLAASDFAAADCVPALLCLNAKVEISARGYSEQIDLEDFLRMRLNLEPGRLLTRITVPRNARKTAHARLPLRKAGDYPAAIVSLAVGLDAAGRIETAGIAVGSVEPTARRWKRLEAALLGQPLDPRVAAERAAELADEFLSRESVDVPAWYRLSVLPSLVRRAAAAALQISG